MANYDDIVTNQQILDIANGIRKVTRTTGSMTILQMPERLLDIRVIETRRISVELNSPAPLLIGTYDESVKHLFIILPITEQDAQTLNKTKPALEISTLSGEIALHYQTPTEGTVNLLLIDCLLPDNEETQGILIPQLVYLELDRLDSRIDETAANLSTLAGEVSAFDEAVNDLSSGLAQEIADRAAADADLLSSIQLESARAQAAEANLQTAIDTEKQRAEAQEGILSDAINAETAQRIAADNALSLRTTEIEQKIPTQATAENQLADKEFVNSSIAHMAARYVTPTPEANSVWTSFAALNNGPWYYNGSAYTPTQHDYAIYTEEDGSQWRASYEGSQWAKQFKINDTPFTAAQIAALNSNITAPLVDKLVGIEPGAQVNVQSDWAETNTESDAFIKNKPTAMPADGGNADTVDGKHASEFATAEQGLKADNAVPNTREINGKALSADITLTPADIGAATAEQGAKADTALQIETDPTVPEWAKQPTKPAYTKDEVGLGNVDNIQQATKTEFNAHNTDDIRHITAEERSSWNNKADLVGGKVPASQLPSYVGDVFIFDSITGFPTMGEDGKIYVARDTNLIYRWNGTGYTEISPSLALGETPDTAYRGDRGKIAYDHSQSTGNPHQTTFDEILDKPTTLDGYGITGIDASQITSGTLSSERIPDLNASKIRYGTFTTDRIPNLNTAKITSGVFNVERIPNLNAEKITSGTLYVERIPDLSASKITSGTLDPDRLPYASSSSRGAVRIRLASGNLYIYTEE